jgi:hypothetical protein
MNRYKSEKAERGNSDEMLPERTERAKIERCVCRRDRPSNWKERKGGETATSFFGYRSTHPSPLLQHPNMARRREKILDDKMKLKKTVPMIFLSGPSFFIRNFCHISVYTLSLPSGSSFPQEIYMYLTC